jgi:hypothetical protein
MLKPTKDDFLEDQAHYLPELPPGPQDDPYILDLVPCEFTANLFTVDD